MAQMTLYSFRFQLVSSPPCRDTVPCDKTVASSQFAVGRSFTMVSSGQ